MKKRWIKIICITGAALLLVMAITPVAFVAHLKNSDGYVQFDSGKLNEVYTALTVLDNKGEVISEPLYINNYKQIPLSALQKYTYMAFVSVEDKRFFEHNGIDYRRVLGAGINNLKSGRYKEGASTISQQLIKNTHLTNGKTIERKVNEMLLAKELESKYSKNEILEMYLNTIYFGRRAYGIETAANVYFNKSAKDLTISESAILAGMIKAPNNYAPDKNAEKCRSRRDTVLKIMLEQNVIDEKEYEDAMNSEIIYSPEEIHKEKTYNYFVMEEAAKLLNMTPIQLAKSNFVIETYCDNAKQKVLAELAVNDSTLTEEGKLADMSCIVCNNTGGIEACYFRGDNANVKRQVGSALKPIAVYAPAFNEKIITQASPILDEETNFNGYKPANAGGYNGWTTVKNAVAKSLNVPAVKTLNALSLKTAEKYLKNFGIEGEQNLSLALGNANGGIDPLTLAKCYAALANDGVCNETAFIKNIYNENGLIYSRELQNKRVFNSSANYLMTDLLINTTKNGTAKNLFSTDFQIAAKTGTVGNSAGNTDALVAGYTTENTFLVWYSGKLPNNVNGSTSPCKFANSLLRKIYSEYKPANFERPNGIEELQLDKDSLYREQLQILTTSKGEKFLFDKDNKPKRKLEEKNYGYKISVTQNDNEIKLSLPAVENCKWYLYGLANGSNPVKIELTSNTYCAKLEQDEEFYAEMYSDGKMLYRTPTLKICVTKTEPDSAPDFPSILDFWYFQ